MKKIIIYGNGQYARMLYCEMLQEKSLKVEAFTADREYIKNSIYLDLPLIPFDEIEEKYPPKDFDMLVVIAFAKMRNRKLMFKKAKNKGYHLVNYYGPNVVISNTCTIGENNIIGAGTYIGPFGKIGNNNMIRPHNYIGHDTRIHHHSYIAPGCKIGGGCEIKESCFIGIGSILKDEIIVEDETLIGAGALVLKNTEAYSKYIGTPARKTGEHPETGIQLKL